MKQLIIDKYLELFLAFLICIFVFISFILSTIAISHIILFFFFIILFYKNIKDYRTKIVYLKEYKTPFVFLFLFFLWIFFQPFLISGIDFNVLKEVKSQFLIPILFFISGIFLILSNFKMLNPRYIFNIVFFTGLIHILLLIIFTLLKYFQTGILPIRSEFILHVNEMSYFGNLMYSFFLAEIYNRVINKDKFLFIKGVFLPIIFIVFVFSVYLQGMRWGVATFCLTTIFFTFLILVKLKISFYKKILSSFVIITISTLAYGNLKYDTRWGTFLETIKIIVNDNSLYWLNDKKYDCPKLENNDCVDPSNYLRLSQFIQGVKLGMENPLGTGYSRYSYYNVLLNKYKEVDSNNAFPHSGLINFFIGVGYIGILLYGTFIYYLIRILFNFESSYPKIFTVFFIISFHSRALVDMTFMNHNLKMFFFILGIGLFSALYENIRIKNEKTKLN